MNEPLEQLIQSSMLRDQGRFRRRWEGLRTGDGAGLARLRGEVVVSAGLRRQRAGAVPVIRFPEELPVSGKREELAAVIRDHQVIVVCGETGSGKTTQIPKICLEMGRGVAGMIGHTQPRRIAARAVSARIAEELGGKVGGTVGFKIRFSDNVSPTTLIKLMTDGILLAETQTDPLLSQYDTIIIDEAHERSLNIDFLLGYLKQLLPKRPDLKLIITSATIDPESFARHFGGTPVVMVSGRTYPVEVRYRDPRVAPVVDVEEDGERVVEEIDEEAPDMLRAIVEGVGELMKEGSGDILVFLSGEREIRETAGALEEEFGGRLELLPLFARLSAEEQQRVFAASKKRRVVLSTNVAETSLTVPGIRFVIDPGLARISRYSPRSKVQRLPIEPISQASANQRMGRCGRVAAGICIRLYSEEDFVARPLFTEPEIVRTNLAAVILQMKAFRLGAIEEFPFLQPPNARLIADGYQTLLELGAVDNALALTPLGARIARLPIDPRIARMILAGQAEGVEKEVLIIAAALSVQDPRERPLEKQEAADAAHLEFRDEHSDFLAYLKLWEWYHREAKQLSVNKLRRACQARFLSFTRMREWHDVHAQLHELLEEMRKESSAPGVRPAAHPQTAPPPHPRRPVAKPQKSQAKRIPHADDPRSNPRRPQGQARPPEL